MSLEESGSVTQWIGALKAGDADALGPLWERYAGRLMRLARARRARLGGRPGAEADEEDAVLSAFAALHRGAAAGQFPELTDRGDLWRLLAVLTTRKVINQARRGAATKRGGGQVVRAADLATDPGASAPGLDGLAAAAANPELIAQVAEETDRLLDRLGDNSLRQVALWKLEGYTNEEIRARLGCSLRTVTNKLELIRRRWEKAAGEESGPG
jgi:DNA-directed RNA polymerase specialized sigma24 family protein